MEKIIKIIDVIVLSGIFLFVAFVSGFCVGQKGAAQNVQAAEIEEPEIIIPTMVEKRILTVEEVKAKLMALEEFAVYEKEYQVTTSIDATRYFFENVSVPFSCKGVVKTGYDVDKMQISIEDNTIYLTMPEPEILDNHIIWDSVQCEDLDLVMKSEQYQTMLDEVKAEGLSQVQTSGIYDEANINTKLLIENFLQVYDDYDVEFVLENI